MNFVTRLDREDEKNLRGWKSKIEQDIRHKRAMPENKDRVVEADAQFVSPLLSYATGKFKLHPGEYNAEVLIQTAPARSSRMVSYRFTLFESDAGDLLRTTEDYKFGAGVYFPNETRSTTAFVPLAKV